MNKNINYGTINKRGGAKNRLLKFVLCFCLGVVSLLGIGANMTANAQVLDIDTEKIVTSDNSLLNKVIGKDYVGYYDIVGCSGDSFNILEFRLFDFNNNFYGVTGGWNALNIVSNTILPIMLSVSSYNDLSGLKVSLSAIGQHIKYLDLSYVNIMPNGVMGGVSYLFCSRYLYNLYLTSQNSGGASSSELEAEYNKGYTDCQNDMLDDLRQEYQNGYDIGKGEGINEGYNQGYESGYGEGLKDNQDLIYNTGYNDGYSTGEDDGYNKGYDIGFSDSQNDKNSFKELMFSIIDAPFNVLGNAFDFEIFGINMSDFLIAIVSLLLVSVVIRKLM